MVGGYLPECFEADAQNQQDQASEAPEAQKKHVIDGRFWRIPEWFQGLSKEQLDALRVYHYELMHFNGRINLISPKSERNADLIHFSDSILAAQEIMKDDMGGYPIYDVGSGNGLPGMVLSILYPDQEVILLDSDSRKVEFLKHIIHRLGLKNVSTLNVRFEDIEEGSIHRVVSRGFANITKCLVAARKATAPEAHRTTTPSEGVAWITVPSAQSEGSVGGPPLVLMPSAAR